MAQRRYTIVFYVAVFIAAMATYGVYRVLQAAKLSARVATASVVVAAKDVPAGAVLDQQSLEVKQWPAVAVPEEAIANLDAAVGRVARVPIFTGEAIVPGRLARAGTAPGLEARITPGMRAMSVRINDVAGMSGLVQPNSRVDVLVSLREGSSNSEEVSKLFLENMRVLSMGSRTTRDDSGDPTPATTATLEVTPAQAEKLAVAMRQGMIQLVLRGFDDTDSTGTKGSSSSEVLAQLRDAKPAPVVARASSRPARSTPKPRVEVQQMVPPPVAVAPPIAKPDSLTVRVYRGNQVSQQKFQVDTTNGNGTP
jgi:pilus assembly protein CpaB